MFSAVFFNNTEKVCFSLAFTQNVCKQKFVCRWDRGEASDKISLCSFRYLYSTPKTPSVSQNV